MGSNINKQNVEKLFQQFTEVLGETIANWGPRQNIGTFEERVTAVWMGLRAMCEKSEELTRHTPEDFTKIVRPILNDYRAGAEKNPPGFYAAFLRAETKATLGDDEGISDVVTQ